MKKSTHTYNTQLTTKAEKKSINFEGKNIKVKAFSVVPNEIRDFINELKAKGSSHILQSLSFAMLDSAKRIMRAEECGDSSRNNFALSMFENALDHRLGWAVALYIDASIEAYKRQPKPFKLCVTGKGDLFIETSSGRISKLAI